MTTPPPPGKSGLASTLSQAGTVFRSMARGLGLVFRASGFSAYLMFCLTATAGLVPVGVAWMTKLVVDTIGAAASAGRIAFGPPSEGRVAGGGLYAEMFDTQAEGYR